jgi:hypothetical protein
MLLSSEGNQARLGGIYVVNSLKTVLIANFESDELSGFPSPILSKRF